MSSKKVNCDTLGCIVTTLKETIVEQQNIHTEMLKTLLEHDKELLITKIDSVDEKVVGVKESVSKNIGDLSALEDKMFKHIDDMSRSFIKELNKKQDAILLIDGRNIVVGDEVKRAYRFNTALSNMSAKGRWATLSAILLLLTIIILTNADKLLTFLGIKRGG